MLSLDSHSALEAVKRALLRGTHCPPVVWTQPLAKRARRRSVRSGRRGENPQ